MGDDVVSKTPKGLRLAAALRAAREKAGLTLRDLADLVGRDSGGLSRYETGDRTPKPEVVAQLLTAMGVRGSTFDEMMTLAYDTDAPGWVAWTLPAQRQHLAALVDAEQNSSRIDVASPDLFPGLLQEKSYMTAIMSGGGVPADEVVTRVAIRLGRRDVLLRSAPAVLTAFIGEPALHWLIGGPDVMASQFRYTLAQGAQPNVDVRVVPFRAGWQPLLDGAFTVMDGAIIHMETRKSGVFLHEGDDVRIYLDAFERIRETSCDSGESRRMLATRLAELEKMK
jgi:transcriptional regulator with XRE-family HTH domain